MVVITDLHKIFLLSTGVSTDSRNIKEGNIFFALKGPSFNGNSYAIQSLSMGASYAVIDEEVDSIDPRLIRVDDVLECLQELAGFHRRKFLIPVIALTGSNGKTTTKELIHAVLSKRFNVLATKGNLNNHIGVPLTLLNLSSVTEIAIIEMGANRLGEIANLCKIASPTHGLITNIGKAHIGKFGGFENILRAKTELFDYLIKTDGLIWINSEDPALANMAKRIKAPKFFPVDGEFYTKHLSADPFIEYTDQSGERTLTKLIGKYNFLNIAAARAVGHESGVDNATMNAAIAEYIPENNRSQLVNKGNRVIVLDAYNANPSSMEAAIDNFSSMLHKIDEKCMILGDMFELGEDEKEEHEKLGTLTRNSRIKTFYVGRLSKWAADSDPDSKWFETIDDLKLYLGSAGPPGKLILLKGSRGMKLEELLEYL